MAGRTSKNKLVSFLLILPALILSLPSQVFAQSITTGNASAESSVRNEVNGGDVYTKIEVEANGEKKILETSEPGEHELEVSSNENEDPTEESGSQSLEEPNKKEQEETSVTPVQKIFDFISDLFERIVSIFGRG